VDSLAEISQGEWLDKVVYGFVAQGLDRCVHRSVRSHEDDLGWFARLSEIAQELEPGETRHLDVSQDQIEVVLLQDAGGLPAVEAVLNLQSIFLQDVGDQGTGIRVIIDDENTLGHLRQSLSPMVSYYRIGYSLQRTGVTNR
jgi:hypothetical protein